MHLTQRYCAGLVFSRDLSNILLIQKNRPHYLKGKLNAVGGKVEENESPLMAMKREFTEETGVADYLNWVSFLRLKDVLHTYEVFFFYAISDQGISDAKSIIDEPLFIVKTQDILEVSSVLNIVPNMMWITSMALMGIKYKLKAIHHVEETYV